MEESVLYIDVQDTVVVSDDRFEVRGKPAVLSPFQVEIVFVFNSDALWAPAQARAPSYIPMLEIIEAATS